VDPPRRGNPGYSYGSLGPDRKTPVVSTVAGLLFTAACICSCLARAQSTDEKSLRWSVADSIGLNKVTDSAKWSDKTKSSMQFEYSPDGRFVSFVREAPNLATDRVDSTLQIYRVSQLQSFASGGAQPEPTFHMEWPARGSVKAFADLQWSSHGEALFFIFRQSESGKLMAWRPGDPQARALGPDDVLDYTILDDHRVAIFANENKQPWPPEDVPSFDATGHTLSYIFGHEVWDMKDLRPSQLFVVGTTDNATKAYEAWGIPVHGIVPSFDNRYVAIQVPIDAKWARACWHATGATLDTPVRQVAIVDLQSGQTSQPFGGPLASGVIPSHSSDDVKWSPNSEEFAVPLTLTGNDACSRVVGMRTAAPGAYEFSVMTKELNLLHAFPLDSSGAMAQTISIEWSHDGKQIALKITPPVDDTASNGQENRQPEIITFQRNMHAWRSVDSSPQGSEENATKPPTVLEVKQDSNVLPAVYAVDQSGHARELLDLAPHAHDKDLVSFEKIEWLDSGGRKWHGLFAVPEVKGPRHPRPPLIVQTHGYGPEMKEFFAEGPSTAPYPGRAALARGFALLTVYEFGDGHRDIYPGIPSLEAPRMVEAYKAAIDELSKRGVVDANKVGVIGWSRTSYYVKYALTHSPKLFAAAIAADGLDYGYGQYINAVDWDLGLGLDAQYVPLYGGAPWGNWKKWLSEAPGFNVQNVSAPVLIEGFTGMASLLETEWEFYAAMRILDLPVDLVVYPNAVHTMFRPSQRMDSTQRSLDWFDFWLNNHEDSDPAKAEQYRRWRELRDLRVSKPSLAVAG